MNNNYEIPVLGFGTFRLTGKSNVENAILTALETGYRHIDTAAVYNNETDIGKSIQIAKIDRKDLFITSKVWNSDQGYNSTLQAFERSINKLETDYLDLYLIHWAVKDKYLETWSALEHLYIKGVVKSIGVSNFQIHHLNDIFKNFSVKPAINQIELHPYLSQIQLRDFCKHNQIIVESWSPIAKGKVSDDKLLKIIADKYGKTQAQIVIRWHIQNNFVVIPKSATKERIIENFKVFDFKLSVEDTELINSLNKDLRIGPDPDNFDF